jgi:hypothetical protein
MNIPRQRIELASNELVKLAGRRHVIRMVRAARVTDVTTSPWACPTHTLRQWRGHIYLIDRKVQVYAYHTDGEEFDSRQTRKYHIWSDDRG